MQDSLVEVQSQLAFQEDTITELNRVLTQQQSQIDSLKLEISLLKEHYEEVIDMLESSAPAADEKPPHY